MLEVTGSMGSYQSNVARNWAIDGLGIVPLAIWSVAVAAVRLGQSAKLLVCTQMLVSKLQQGPHALNTLIR